MKRVNWKNASHFEGPEQSIGFLLWQVSTLWRRKIEAALAKIDLTHPQFVLLACLGWLTRDNAAISQVELARHCRTDITMTSQVLRTLETRGYIERIRHSNNERSKFPRLTHDGAQLVEKALPMVETIDQEFFGKLKSDPQNFLKMLHQLN